MASIFAKLTPAERAVLAEFLVCGARGARRYANAVHDRYLTPWGSPGDMSPSLYATADECLSLAAEAAGL